MTTVSINKAPKTDQLGLVLLVDDDASLRRVTEYSLQSAGYRVLTANDGQKGLEAFRDHRPSVVITDIQMPRMTGYELLKTVRTESPDTLVIVITAYGSVEKAVEAMKAGAYDYITKPFSRDEMILIVERAFALLGLQTENRRLRDELQHQIDFNHMVGISDPMQEVFDVVRRVAPSDATILITGESGTGKELIARAIHAGSERHDSPFVAVNCAAIPAELLESELFGYVKGAFTGATRDRLGKFELANGGTLFLDEVAEMPQELQPKLLRVIQEREIEPLGGELRGIDVRLIAATNRNVEETLKNGRLREDLYYRLSVIPIQLPPLRQRIEDIPLLVRHFLERYAEGQAVTVTPETLEYLTAYEWPGNVRELQNTIQRMVILRKEDSLKLNDLPEKIRKVKGASLNQILQLPDDGYSLEALEKEAVLQALERNKWNQTHAAAFLKIPRHTLIYRMEKYEIVKR
ncbi:MAG: sigma-54-dependent Fis family transcriptional regulator [Deltaproteobacteria bacterium]|jgi:two-component system NtrC family response regulator|nr:sigma-54-dependent Fis family transcriptional regulator [Deltaproteobacteria bacterium]